MDNNAGYIVEVGILAGISASKEIFVDLIPCLRGPDSIQLLIACCGRSRDPRFELESVLTNAVPCSEIIEDG
jgi:hypothetical protein